MITNLWERDGVPFAVDAAGHFRDVAEVPRGLACGCFCADCKGSLVAKKGEIKAHHFAHHDRRECRYALEASLFGMLMTLVREPGQTLGLPPCGERRLLVPRPEQVFTSAQAERFFATPWVIDAASVTLKDARFSSNTITESTAAQPEIRLPGLDVHILSHRKRDSQIAAKVAQSGPAILLLDLRDYASIWWNICDEHRGETMEAARSATSVMVRWLQKGSTGRVWLFHPEFEKKKRELDVWIAEKSRVAAEWRQRERLRRVPQFSPRSPHAPADGTNISSGIIQRPIKQDGPKPDAPRVPHDSLVENPPVGYIRTVKDGGSLTTHMAAEFALWRDANTGRFVFLGRPGEVIPSHVQEILEPNAEWRPVFAADEPNFTSAKQLLRAAIAPYSLPRDQET